VTAFVTPRELADLLQPVLEHGMIGFDVDGVLAPIVEHADQSQLSPGVAAALGRLAEVVPVIILSGRSLESVERLFRFAPTMLVVGSHGLEVRGTDVLALDRTEQRTFEELRALGEKTVDAIGEGAWLEHKPASVVVHTRAADERLAQPAVDALVNLVGMVEGASVKHGHSVVELLARDASKGTALLGFARALERSPIAYLGDDLTDEDAFRLMSGNDVSVRVGPGDTNARFRLADTAAVAELLELLVAVG
jgi:trehalose 6-phosphate phosphatase